MLFLKSFFLKNFHWIEFSSQILSDSVDKIFYKLTIFPQNNDKTIPKSINFPEYISYTASVINKISPDNNQFQEYHLQQLFLNVCRHRPFFIGKYKRGLKIFLSSSCWKISTDIQSFDPMSIISLYSMSLLLVIFIAIS